MFRGGRQAGNLHSLLKPKITASQMRTIVEANNRTHVAPPIPLGPYTTVRGRVVIPITTNISGQTTCLLLGAHTEKANAGSRDLTISPTIGISGLGTGVPGTTETAYVDALIATYAATLAAGVSSAQLHSLTVHVNCTSNANTAEGLVYMGSVSQRMNRSRFASWNDVAGSAINRSEIQPLSSYNVLAKPVKMSAFPVDMSDWCSQLPLVLSPGASGDNVTLDTLSQLVIVWPPTTVVVSYSLTVYTEWRVNFVDAVLASTAVAHAATDMGIWSSISNAGSETAGFLGNVLGTATSMSQASTLFHEIFDM